MPSFSRVLRTGRWDCSTRLMISAFRMRGISCRLSPIPDHAFFEQAVLEGQVGHDLLQGGGLPTQLLHLVRRGSPRRVAGEPLLARLKEVLRPAIIHRRGDALAAAQLRDALL